ncbi:MAG: sugar phosphate isomerase/epimerase [Clostridia bacterium]|nr:sugar phosphate isomerase/epimerase [Clostridia bacterium]
MKISTEIHSGVVHVGEEKTVELLAKAGFTAFDFSMCDMFRYDWNKHCVIENGSPLRSSDYLAFARRVKQVGLDNGIVCNQSHAPYPMVAPGVYPYILRAIECTAEAGGDICVIHPDNNGTPEQNAEIYHKLLEFAKPYGVRIATENMFNWDSKNDCALFAACATPESFNAHLDAVNDPSLVACLDIGHAEMKGSGTTAVEMIEALGSRLQALHIHDNDKWHDNHQIPFSMDIDYAPIAAALKRIGYNGYFTLEADSFLIQSYNADNLLEGMKKLFGAVKRIHDMVNN